jgi:uncharacterized membrane protein
MKSTTPLSVITATARVGLSGSWGKSIGVMMIYMLLLIGLSLVPVVEGVLQLIFAAPLMVGLYVYFLATVNQDANPVGLLFEGFNRFGTSWCTQMLVTLIIFVCMLPFVAIGVAVMLLFHPDPSVAPAYTSAALFAVLALVASLFIITIQMRYFFALYIVADDETVRAREAVKLSAELMQGNYWRLALLWLRFTGWQILAMLTLGIGFLWVVPYFSAATAAFYLDMKKNG